MPEIVNGITVPVDGDPVDLPGDLHTFATDVGAAAAAVALAAVSAGEAGGAATLDEDAKLLEVQLPDRLSADGLTATFAHPVSTDGTDGLPMPSGVGVEMVIDAEGLQDIRLNGVSL